MANPIDGYVRIRFPSKDAARAYDAALLKAVKASKKKTRHHFVPGKKRAVVLAPIATSDIDSSVRFVSAGARAFADRFGLSYVTERHVERGELPPGLYLLVGNHVDDPK